MPNSKFIAYQPNTSSYASRHADEEWEQHYTLLHTMHTQGRPRWQMRQALEAKGFKVSSGQLTRKMKEWDLMVTDNRRSPPETAETGSPASIEYDSYMIEQCSMTMRAQLTGRGDHQASDASEHIPIRRSTADGLQSTQPLRQTRQCSWNSLHEMDTDDPIVAPGESIIFGPQSWPLTSAVPEQIARERILLLEPCDYMLRSQCCCKAFFHCKGTFQDVQELYRLFKVGSSDKSTVRHGLSLILYAHTCPRGTQSLELQQALREAIERYLQLCTNVNTKNIVANAIVHAMLEVLQEMVGNELVYTPDVMAHLGLVCKSDLTRDAPDNVDRLRNLLYQIFSVSALSCTYRIYDQVELRSFMPNMSATDAESRDVVRLFERLFPEVTTSNRSLNDESQTSWQHSHSPGQRLDDKDFIGVVRRTSLALTARLEGLHLWRKTAASILARLCESIGVLSAMELSCTGHQPLEAIWQFGDIDSLTNSRLGTQGTIGDETTSNRQYIESAERESDFARALIASALCRDPLTHGKFRQCVWLTTAGHLGTEKPLHFGYCRYLRNWALINLSIHDFDEEITRSSRLLFLGRNTWAQPTNPVEDDSMSVRSTSSDNSFRRFRELALHLKLGSTPSLRSFLTKSSSRMSLDSHLSWELEHRMGITDTDLEPTLTETQRAQQDQEAYDRMQTIKEE